MWRIRTLEGKERLACIFCTGNKQTNKPSHPTTPTQPNPPKELPVGKREERIHSAFLCETIGTTLHLWCRTCEEGLLKTHQPYPDPNPDSSSTIRFPGSAILANCGKEGVGNAATYPDRHVVQRDLRGQDRPLCEEVAEEEATQKSGVVKIQEWRGCRTHTFTLVERWVGIKRKIRAYRSLICLHLTRL